MSISPETYERVALEDLDNKWELVCGRLRRKPDMTTEHNDVARTLGVLLGRQLELAEFTVGTDSARLRISTGTYYVPDLCVIPRAMVRRLQERPGTFEVYDDPVPLVVEVWSPSTGEYDVEDKLQEYQWRHDVEIWRIHPYERTITAWCRQPDGTYVETVYRGGVLRPIALPGVTIDFDTLFMI
jgi:Uma2 family endonuclease